MDRAIREWVRRRANDRCEYCNIPQEATPLIPFHIEHIVARQHKGDNGTDNLALACDRCNAHKGTNLTTILPASGKITPIFNPRTHTWEKHFRFEGGKRQQHVDWLLLKKFQN